MNEKANLLCTQVWWRTASRFAALFSFRHYTTLTMPQAKHMTDIESGSFVLSLAHDIQHEKFFIDKKAFFKEVGGVNELVKVLTEKQMQSYQIAIDSASIILAHSILDAGAIDYFRVIEIAAPVQDLEMFISNRQIRLEDLKGLSYDEIASEKIHNFVIELDRKPLLEKIDRIFQVCQPPTKYSPIRGYVYERDKIEQLDNLRHEIVHGDGISSPLLDCDKKVTYMRRTADFLMNLVNYKYDVKIDPTAFTESYLKQHRQSPP